MIPADKLTAIAKSIVKKWEPTNVILTDVVINGVDSGPHASYEFSEAELVNFVEIVLACGAAHEEHRWRHGR